MSTRTHVDEKGELVRASPAQHHDVRLEGDRFACQRNWYFQSISSVESVKGPEAAQAMRCPTFENALDDRGRSVDDRLLSGAKAWSTESKPKACSKSSFAGKIRIADVDINMRIDVVTPEGVLDWKTIKRLDAQRRPGELRADRNSCSTCLPSTTGFEFKVEARLR